MAWDAPEKFHDSLVGSRRRSSKGAARFCSSERCGPRHRTPSEVAAGETLSAVTNLTGDDVDLDLSTLDLDAVWHFNPGNRLVPYVLAGVGYARANLDDPILGTVDGQPVSIDDDSGFTLNAGAGAKFYVNDRFLVRLEARYRYLDGMLDQFDDSLNTVETTLGVGWQF